MADGEIRLGEGGAIGPSTSEGASPRSPIGERAVFAGPLGGYESLVNAVDRCYAAAFAEVRATRSSVPG